MKTDIWGPHRGTPWMAGPWTAELRGDEIAELRHGSVLILRSIRAVVRDSNWRTVPVTVLSSRTCDDGVATTLSLRYDGLGIDADADLCLRVDGDNLDIALSITPAQTFDTNRTGLVVLHPPRVAGAPLSIEHGDGEIEFTSFPDHISPHQPAFDISALRWSSDGLDLTVAFKGDAFEMEDQRNWTDGSFKTYSRPLSLPFPYRLEAGSRTTQRIALTVVPAPEPGGARAEAVPANARARPLRLVDVGRPAPLVGTGAAPASAETSAASTTTPADTVLVEIDARETDAYSTAALDRARATSRPLDVRIVAEHPVDIGALVRLAAEYRPIRIGVFSSVSHVTEPELWHALVAATQAHVVTAELIGGARSHFTELNRAHHRLPPFTAYAISVSPQMHARDTFQIEESIGMQRRVAVAATKMAQGAPLHVGPVTLRPRFNAVATTAATQQARTVMDPDTIDERQASPQLATWLVASAAALAEGGAASVTWFEERGPRGIQTDDGTPFPVYEAMAAVQEIGGNPLLLPAETSSDDATTWVLGARTQHGVRLLIAQLGDKATDTVVDVDGQLVDIHLEPGTWRAIELP